MTLMKWQRVAVWTNGLGAAFLICSAIHDGQIYMLCTATWLLSGWWQSRSAYRESLREQRALPSARVVP